MVDPKILGIRTLPRQNGSSSVYPVVLIRGLGRSSGFWLNFPSYLSEQRNVILLDLLGTGQSPSFLGRGSVSKMAQDVAATLRHHHLLPCHLAGISLGGMVALQTAALLSAEQDSTRAQHDLKSLVVMASSARCTGKSRVNRRALLPMFALLGCRLPKNRAIAPFLVNPTFLEHHCDLIKTWDRLWTAEGFARIAVLRQLLAAAFFDGQSLFPSLKMPTLYMASQDDRLVDWKNSEAMWQRSPNAHLHLLRGCGHDFPTECPEKTATTLNHFWKTIEQTGDSTSIPRRIEESFP